MASSKRPHDDEDYPRKQTKLNIWAAKWLRVNKDTFDAIANVTYVEEEYHNSMLGQLPADIRLMISHILVFNIKMHALPACVRLIDLRKNHFERHRCEPKY